MEPAVWRDTVTIPVTVMELALKDRFALEVNKGKGYWEGQNDTICH